MPPPPGKPTNMSIPDWGWWQDHPTDQAWLKAAMATVAPGGFLHDANISDLLKCFYRNRIEGATSSGTFQDTPMSQRGEHPEGLVGAPGFPPCTGDVLGVATAAPFPRDSDSPNGNVSGSVTCNGNVSSSGIIS